MVTGSTGIIFAADLSSRSELFRTVQEVAAHVEYIKLGNSVLYKYGWGLVGDIKKISARPVIADLKLMDIPEIAERVARQASNAGTDAITVAGSAGAETMQSCVNAMQGKQVFIFTEFTHCSGHIPPELADEYIDLAVAIKCSGVQVPGTKPERIRKVREMVGPKMIILSCGIGTQRTCKPDVAQPGFGSAVDAGANYEIIGRSIYDAEKRGLSAAEAAHEIKNLIERRKVSNEARLDG